MFIEHLLYPRFLPDARDIKVSLSSQRAYSAGEADSNEISHKGPYNFKLRRAEKEKESIAKKKFFWIKI